MSQSDRILSWLNTHEGLTPREAYREFGCLRLAARISDLKKPGHPIISDRLHVGKGTWVAVYRLENAAQSSLGL